MPGQTAIFAFTPSGFDSVVVNGDLRAPAGTGGPSAASGVFPVSPSPINFFRDVVFVADVAGDTTPPTVSIDQPIADSAISGQVTISATASDDVGVIGVQFQVDGVNIGSEVAPYRTASIGTASAWPTDHEC